MAKNIADTISQIAALLPDNTAAAISPADLRTVSNNLASSYINNLETALQTMFGVVNYSAGLKVGGVLISSGVSSPIGAVTGTPGDIYIQVTGATSKIYQHNGTAADNTSWMSVTHPTGFGDLSLHNATALTGTTAVFQVFNSTNFGGGLSWTSNETSTAITQDLVNGAFIVTENSTVAVNFSLSFGSTGNPTTEYEFTLGVDTGAGFVSQEARCHQFRTTTSTSELGYVGLMHQISLNAGDKIGVMMQKNSGTADIDKIHGNYTIRRIL